MSEPLVIIGMPESSIKILQLIARKTGQSMVEVLSEALKEKARKHLTAEEIKAGVK